MSVDFDKGMPGKPSSRDFMRPWLAHYDADVPHSLAPYPERTLIDYLAQHARKHGDDPGLVFEGKRISWAELERLSNAFAAALTELGVGAGDRIALILPNCPQFLIAEFGAWKVGAIVAPLNPVYTEHELATLLASSGARVAVVLTRYYERLKTFQPRTAVTTVIATNIKEYLKPLTRLLFTAFKEKEEGDRVELRDGDLAFAELLHRDDIPRPVAHVRPQDDATILPSGGTTGIPKGVVGSHRNMVLAGLQLHVWLHSALEDGRDVLMVPLPLFHVYGLIGVQSLSIIARMPMLLVANPRDIKGMLHAIAHEKPSFFCTVPALLSALLNHASVVSGKASFTSLKICFSGGAPLMAETIRRYQELTGGRLIEGYSLTEAQMAAIANPVRGANKVGSIGMPLPDVDVRVVDADEGATEVAQGEVGEVIIRAPQRMRGYWGNEAETKLVMRQGPDGDTWLYTGDLGYLDEDGYIFLVDRKKDLIKVSGYQVWPREIEEVLATHPSVSEVGVAAIPDPTKGEVPKAWVVPRAGATPVPDELRAYCRERLAPYKVPSQIVIVAELPKSGAGKILRRKLKELQ
jgi:long-chain acyl-CoA synthetase